MAGIAALALALVVRQIVNPPQIAPPQLVPPRSPETPVEVAPTCSPVSPSPSPNVVPSTPTPTERQSPEDMVRRYYELIDSDRFPEAYLLRSRRSHSTTRLTDFQKTWSNNNSVKLERIALASNAGTSCTVTLRLLADDTNLRTGLRTTTPYGGKIDLVFEDGSWRYDGGNFRADTAAASQVPPPTLIPLMLGKPRAVVRFHHVTSDGSDTSGPLLDVWAGFGYEVSVDLTNLDPTRSHLATFRGYSENQPDKWEYWGDLAKPISISSGRDHYACRWLCSPLIGASWFTLGRDKLEVVVDDQVLMTQFFRQILPPAEQMKANGRDPSRYPKRW